MKILDKWENLKMMDGMRVFTFMQYMYDLLNNLREINKLPSYIAVVLKVLKNLLAKFETFIRVLQSEKDTPTLANLASRLHRRNGDEFEWRIEWRSVCTEFQKKHYWQASDSVWTQNLKLIQQDIL